MVAPESACAALYVQENTCTDSHRRQEITYAAPIVIKSIFTNSIYVIVRVHVLLIESVFAMQILRLIYQIYPPPTCE